MKKYILGLITGILVCGSIGLVIAATYNAGAITYTPSDNTWNVSNVESAINDLKNISDNGFKLVGEKEISFSSGQTTPTKVNIEVKDSNYISVENNIVKIKKSGKYIIFLEIGANQNYSGHCSFSGFLDLYINGTKVVNNTAGSASSKSTYHIYDLSVNDEIYANIYGDGDNYPKIARIKIFKY